MQQTSPNSYGWNPFSTQPGLRTAQPPKKQLDSKMPFKMLFSKKPDLSDLPEWGAKVWVLKEEHGKLDAKADEGR